MVLGRGSGFAHRLFLVSNEQFSVFDQKWPGDDSGDHGISRETEQDAATKIRNLHASWRIVVHNNKVSVGA